MDSNVVIIFTIVSVIAVENVLLIMTNQLLHMIWQKRNDTEESYQYMDSILDYTICHRQSKSRSVHSSIGTTNINEEARATIPVGYYWIYPIKRLYMIGKSD